MNNNLPSIFLSIKNHLIFGKIVESNGTIDDSIIAKFNGKYLDVFIKCSVVSVNHESALCCLIINNKKSEFNVNAESHFIDLDKASPEQNDFLKLRDFADNYNLMENEFLFNPKWINLTFSPQLHDFGFEEK